MRIWTNAFGEIIHLSERAAALVGNTDKSRGMSLALLFDGNRDSVTRALDGVARSRVEQFAGVLRAKGTRPLSVSVRAEADRR